LTHPLRYNSATDKYEPIGWSEAFAAIGAELKSLDPKSTVFYTSGHGSLETAYLYGLFARVFGHNNLPTVRTCVTKPRSVALKKTIGSAVGTVTFEDLAKGRRIVLFWTKHVRIALAFYIPCETRSVAVQNSHVQSFARARARALSRSANPFEMLTGIDTRISCQYHQ